MKPFNLEAAKAGAPVVDSEGRPYRVGGVTMSLNKDQVTNTIDALLQQSREMALRYISEQVDKVFDAHPNIAEFDIGMGEAFFTTADGQLLDVSCAPEYALSLLQFVRKYDSELKLTGDRVNIVRPTKEDS